MLDLVRLNSVKARTIRTLLIDVLTLSASLLAWRKHQAFYGFSLQIVLGLQTSAFEKLNLMRNVLKKVGTYEIVQRFNRDRALVLVDEGTVHAAHNLFVHLCREPDWRRLEQFVKLIPLPDVAVCVSADEADIVGRTLKRGHKRIRVGTRENVELFVRRALAVFSVLEDQPGVSGRCVSVRLAPEPDCSDARQLSFESATALVQAVLGLRTAVML